MLAESYCDTKNFYLHWKNCLDFELSSSDLLFEKCGKTEDKTNKLKNSFVYRKNINFIQFLNIYQLLKVYF